MRAIRKGYTFISVVFTLLVVFLGVQGFALLTGKFVAEAESTVSATEEERPEPPRDIKVELVEGPKTSVVLSVTTEQLARYIMKRQSMVTSGDADKMASSVLHWAEEYDVPLLVVVGVIEVESLFQPYAISDKGARGLMQVMPTVWRQEFDNLKLDWFPQDDRDLYDVDVNVRIGVKILSVLRDRSDGDWKKAVNDYYHRDHGAPYLKKVQETSMNLVWWLTGL